jgi:serine/threonine protein kinase
MAISIADSSSGSPPPPFFGVYPELEKAPLPPPKLSMWQRLGLGRWLHRDDSSRSCSPGLDQRNKPHAANLGRRLSRRVGVGLPRPPTFRRQNSERRDRLAPADPEPRRAVSAGRHRALSVQRTRSPPPATVPARLSAPEVQSWRDDASRVTLTGEDQVAHDNIEDHAGDPSHFESGPYNDIYSRAEDLEDPLELELEKRWILNLSMHFRDKSEREKFFVTYAETPNRWRRVTVSCDYRGAPPDSLEQDLKELHYQRDKSARIYESIRESLPEIQFYDTVTNLKLETSDGRLHVHVTEDINEIIPYPPSSSVRHLGARLIPEYKLEFDAHLSGFVYKVRLDGKAYIKKEIPGPDTVDEFLYEINALHALSGSTSVIRFEGIIVDDHGERVKGLLISYAEQGALVDVLYDYRGQLPLARRERWAKQIVQGLCEIHEAGYVQGDFTLSNIVIDADDNAKIIDINRRGCPVGWEPPEIAAKIESNQRISMYIGVKSDLFQLGMTLWALAMQEDEPERHGRPLLLPADAKVPDYYSKVVSLCLSPRPQDRLSAKELLSLFPLDLPEAEPTLPSWTSQGPPSDRTTGLPFYSASETSVTHHHSVCLEDHHADVLYIPPAGYGDSLGGHLDEESDYPSRGRQPSTHALHLSDYHLSSYQPSSASPQPNRRRSISQSEFEPQLISPDQEARLEEVEVNGTSHLVPADTFTAEEFQAIRDQTHQSQDLQSAQSSGFSRVVAPSSTGDARKDVEADLETSLDPPYHESKSGDGESEHFQIEALSGDLAGVGGHPSCSLGKKIGLSIEDHAPLSGILSRDTAVSQAGAPSDVPLSPSTAPSVDAEAQRISKQLCSDIATGHNVSLLDSQLPINPALAPTPPKIERPPGPPSRTSFLLDSRLPINPACSSIFLDGSYSAASMSAHLSA